MSMMYQSGAGGVEFTSLGLTTTLSGITLTTTLVNTSDGSTTFCSISPTALNYVLGSQIVQAIAGVSYQTFTNGVLSLTVPASRNVDCSIHWSTAGNGYLQIAGTDSSSWNGSIRVLRGPSTVISDMNVQDLFSGAGSTSFIARYPVSAFRFRDFAPPGGAATYILQAATNGLSTQLSFNGSNFLVAQI